MQKSARVRLAMLSACLGGCSLGQPAPVIEPDDSTQAIKTDSVRIEGTTATLELVRTPAGEVTLDGEEHEIPPLWVGVTEVTWDLYDVYLYGLDVPRGAESGQDSRQNTGTDGAADGVTRPSKPYVPPDRGYGHNGFAAIGMTRHAAERFCHWLTVKTGARYRLPTEAEWVYLASGGDARGQRAAATGESAWVEENSDWTPHKVGLKPANVLGLHDTLGNVAEWVESADRPPVAMGGSFLDPAAACTPLSKQAQTSTWNSSDPQIPKSRWWLADCGFVGFRMVREIPRTGDDRGAKQNRTE